MKWWVKKLELPPNQQPWTLSPYHYQNTHQKYSLSKVVYTSLPQFIIDEKNMHNWLFLYKTTYHNYKWSHVHTRSVGCQILPTNINGYCWCQSSEYLISCINNIPCFFCVYMIRSFRIPCFIPNVLKIDKGKKNI